MPDSPYDLPGFPPGGFFFTGERMTSSAGSPPGYLVCTHPRSGSSYFCELLESTGVLGNPKEYFNAANMRALTDPAYPTAPAEQFAYFTAHAATSNGISAGKVFWFNFAQIAQAGLAGHFRDYRFVVLERADKVAQAISASRGLRSGKLTAASRKSDDHVAYDYEDIKRRLVGVLKAEALWWRFFAANRIDPLHCLYEALMDDPQATVDRIAASVGVPMPASIDPARVSARVQRDTRSAQWRERFLDEARRNDPELLDRPGSIVA